MKTKLRFFSRKWLNYKSFVAENTIGDSGLGRETIHYWQQKLFTNFITYLLPCCLFALLPGVVMCLISGYHFVAGFSLLAVGSIAVVALDKRLGLTVRKVFVIAVIYAVSGVLIVYIGIFGPGILYLLVLSVLVTLIFPPRFAYWSVLGNLVVCVLCALVVDLFFLKSRLSGQYSTGVWIITILNLVLVCWVITALINNTIQNLARTLAKEFTLREQLLREKAQAVSLNRRILESAENYKSLFFLSPSPMWVLDRESLRFLQVNEAAVAEYGYSTEEFLTMSIHDIKMEDDMRMMENDLREGIEAEVPLSIVTRHRRKNQEIFQVEVRFNTISFRGKHASLAIMRDITEQVGQLASIESQNVQLREIAWLHAHSVRRPLANINALAGLISEQRHVKPDTQVLDHLCSSVEELDEVIRNITDSAKGY